MAETAKVRLSRFPWWFWVVMAGLFAILVLTFGWFLTSPAFNEMVRNRVVAELEKATGGTVQLQSLTWNVAKLEIEAKGITIRGLEPANEVPLAHADRLYARLHVASLVSADIDLQQLTLDQPVIHLMVGPDGSTNVPQPKTKKGGDPLQQLFELAIGRAEVQNGALLLNDEKIPLDFKANDIGLAMGYERIAKRYDGALHVGKMDTRIKDLRDIPSTADAEFSLRRNKLEVKSLKLVSQKSSLKASGTVDDFNQPKTEVTYAAELDLVQLGEIARAYKLRGGTASLSGSAAFAAPNLASSGKLTVRGFTYDEPGFEIRNADAAAEFALDRERISLKKISGRVLGGSVTGDAEVRHYAPALETTTAEVSTDQPAPAKPSAGQTAKNRGGLEKPRAVPVQQGSARLKISGASLAELLGMMAGRELPLDKLNAVGSVNGTINVAWKETVSRAVLEIAADCTPPTEVASGQLPTSGTFSGRYNVSSGVTEITTLTLATPHTEMNASGTLGLQTAELSVAVNSNGLEEFQPMLSAMGESALPIEINGRASFSGTVRGKLAHPDVAGRLLATDFSYLHYKTPPATPPPTTRNQLAALLNVGKAEPQPAPAPEPRRIHIDSFAGDVEYGGTMLALRHGVIQRGSAHLNVEGSAQLENGGFTEQSRFEVRASVRNASVSDLQSVAGTDYPISGVVDASLQATGNRANPNGSGTIALTEGEAYGYPIKTAVSDIVVVGREAQLQNIRVEALGGTATGMTAYNFDTRELRSDLRGEGIDLAQIKQLQSGPLQDRGTASFAVKSSGTLEAPMVDAHVQIANLAINDELQGDLRLDAVTRGDRLQITGRSKFPHGSITLDGTVDEHGEMQSDIGLQFADMNIDPLVDEDFRSHITGHSSLNGRASLSGPLRRPRTMRGKMQVDAFSVSLDSVAIHSDGPIEAALADQVLTVKRFTLRSEDTNVTVGGTMDLKERRPLDLYAKGHLNMALFHALDEEITSYGSCDMDVTVTGTVDKPIMNGRVVIAHAGFSVIDLPAAMGEMNGTMVFNQDRLEVEQLAGKVGGGQVQFSGYITYGKTIGFDLNSSGTDIRFRYAGVSVTADQSLRLSGTLKSSLLSGEVTITRFAQIPATDVTAAFAPEQVSVPNPASPLNNLRLDVRIVSTPELTVQTTLAKLSGDVDLKLRGTGTRPTLLGRINVASGDIKVNGTKYHLDRGDVTFANPIRIDPILDVEATTRVRDYDITVGLHGTVEKLTTTYRSDPPLSSDDIIALLAFGRTQEESYGAGRGNNLGEGAGGVVLGALINQTVTNRASKLFGVSSIRINPAVGGPDNNPSARLTIEQQVSNNVTLTYITNLTQSAQQVIQFEYNINSEYTVQGIRDENGVVSFDLLIRKRKK